MRCISRILVVALACLSVAAQAQKWRFVVAGDGRSDPKNNRPEDKDGVNVLITGEVAQAVLKENAKFLLWTGDLAYGSQDPDVFEKMLITWRDLMQPLYDKKIPVLCCRGNHELICKNSEQVWNKVFSGPYALPNNGPDGEKNLSFFYGKGDVLAIGLDQYKQEKETIDQTWLDEVLTKHRKPFIFAFGHEPAFMDGAHKDNLDSHPLRRDAFWESLIKAGSRVFFCGHDHLYDHMAVTRATGAPGPELHQIVAGTAGAPFYKIGEYSGNNTIWKLRRVKHIDETYGYLIVEIDGKTATIIFKGRTAPGVYKEMDRYSYTVK